ncbi:cation:proton antiporter [Arthrobacter flavus]|uniref:Cation:proton antiporter n=1 Tax=Arthrobacter flavus TaxID=95172 RepID=A0ABW4QBH6_9MICC
MTEPLLAVLAIVALAWAVLSDRLARSNITGPLVFVVAGFLLGNPEWGPLTVDVDTPSVHAIAELTLALLLFSDAARVNVAKLRQDIGVPVRLLGIGLMLSIVFGSVLAAWLFDDLGWALACFVGAALAPTDAALSAQVINDKNIPDRVRRSLNVESGLNDGIATPIVMLALAIAASQLGVVGEHNDGLGALMELAVGVVVGMAVGLGSAKVISFSSRRGWLLHGGRRLATLAAAVGSFAIAMSIGGNGFIAAFVAGVAFGATIPRDVANVDEIAVLPELLGEVLALGVWFLFGAALVPVAFEYFSPATLLYAVLSLTVIRMLPVGLSLVGTTMDRETVLFIGWFGPRGLASIVFALLAVEQLNEPSVVGQAVSIVAFTVLLSVFAHGVSAGPLGRRYSRGHTARSLDGLGPQARKRSHE